MWYEIKWQQYKVDDNGSLGNIIKTIHTKRCEDWESALGCYITHINSDDIARIWWICHSVESDVEGHVISGYTDQWGEHITLVADNRNSVTGIV